MPPIHSNQMVSLGVVSLFTKVPTDETLAVVQDKLAADPLMEEHTCIPIDNLKEMLTFCVETTNFGMGSDLFRQEEGLAMSSPLSPVLANIYMEYFGEMALGSTSLKPSMWRRYVDDTFILWPHQEDNSPKTLNNKNQQASSQKFRQLICLYLKIPEKFVRLIFLDGF